LTHRTKQKVKTVNIFLILRRIILFSKYIKQTSDTIYVVINKTPRKWSMVLFRC
jgi:hypothetical protein